MAMDGPGDKNRVPLRQVVRGGFAVFLSAILVSNSGIWVYNLATAVAIYGITGSSFLVGVGTFAQFLFSLLLGSPAGIVADRFDRRRVVAGSQMVIITTSALLGTAFAIDAASVPMIVASNLVIGAAYTMSIPAALAMAGDFAPERALTTATSLIVFTFTAGRALGPLLGAAAIAGPGVAAACWMTAAMSSTLALASPGTRSSSMRVAPPETDSRPRMRDLLAVLRLRSDLMIQFAMGAALSMAADPVITLTPELATKSLGGDASLVGWLVGSFGLGAMLGGLFHVSRQPNGLRALWGSSLGFVGAMMGMVLAPSAAWATAMLATAGFLFALATQIVIARLQVGVEDRTRGRVMGLWMMATLGVRPVAALIDGGIATVATPLLAVATVCTPVVAVVWLGWRRATDTTASAFDGGRW